MKRTPTEPKNGERGRPVERTLFPDISSTSPATPPPTTANFRSTQRKRTEDYTRRGNGSIQPQSTLTAPTATQQQRQLVRTPSYVPPTNGIGSAKSKKPHSFIRSHSALPLPIKSSVVRTPTRLTLSSLTPITVEEQHIKNLSGLTTNNWPFFSTLPRKIPQGMTHSNRYQLAYNNNELLVTAIQLAAAQEKPKNDYVSFLLGDISVKQSLNENETNYLRITEVLFQAPDHLHINALRRTLSRNTTNLAFRRIFEVAQTSHNESIRTSAARSPNTSRNPLTTHVVSVDVSETQPPQQKRPTTPVSIQQSTTVTQTKQLPIGVTRPTPEEQVTINDKLDQIEKKCASYLRYVCRTASLDFKNGFPDALQRAHGSTRLARKYNLVKAIYDSAQQGKKAAPTELTQALQTIRNKLNEPGNIRLMQTHRGSPFTRLMSALWELIKSIPNRLCCSQNKNYRPGFWQVPKGEVLRESVVQIATMPSP